MSEAVRVRVNILTDLNRQRLDCVWTLRGGTMNYARPALDRG